MVSHETDNLVRYPFHPERQLMIKCPVCQAHLGLHCAINDNIITVDVVEPDQIKQQTRYNMLLEATLNYWRWCAERRPPDSHYHDDYHDHVEYSGDNEYSFNIQVYDSPNGDTWWSGTFKVDGRCVIEITSQKYTRS